MPQSALPFQYQAEKNDSGLTGFAGLPLYVELAAQSGLVGYINQTMKTKIRGWTDAEMILALVLLNLAGGDCIRDIERLEQDAGFRTLLIRFTTHGMKRKERRAFEKRWRKAKSRRLPSNAAIHRYLPQFHSPEEEKNRVEGEAFIPKPNDKLKALIGLNKPLIACVQQQSPSTIATLDQDATLTNTYKRKALYCYKGSDPRFGVIPFAIAGRVSAGIKKEALSLDEKHWHPIDQEDADGNKIKTNQEWADICFVPDWAVRSKASYRYLAIREAMKPSKIKNDDELELPFQTIKLDEVRYKLFAVVTNRGINGSDLIQWHRKRCGKSEHVHSTQKEGLAGGQ